MHMKGQRQLEQDPMHTSPLGSSSFNVISTQQYWDGSVLTQLSRLSLLKAQMPPCRVEDPKENHTQEGPDPARLW